MNISFMSEFFIYEITELQKSKLMKLSKTGSKTIQNNKKVQLSNNEQMLKWLILGRKSLENIEVKNRFTVGANIKRNDSTWNLNHARYEF